MSRILIIGLVVIATIAGYPYAPAIIYRLTGTNSIVMTEHDGSQRTLISGPAAPVPLWLPKLPGSIMITATHWVSRPGEIETGSTEILSHRRLDSVKRYYLRALTAAGFDMRDNGFGAANQGGAMLLGIDNELVGIRAEDQMKIRITTRAPSGLISTSRVVQLQWQGYELDVAARNASKNPARTENHAGR